VFPLRFTRDVLFFQAVPDLSPTELQGVIDQLLAAREHTLVHRSVPSLLSSLDRAVCLWLDPSSRERRQAEATLPA